MEAFSELWDVDASAAPYSLHSAFEGAPDWAPFGRRFGSACCVFNCENLFGPHRPIESSAFFFEGAATPSYWGALIRVLIIA